MKDWKLTVQNQDLDEREGKHKTPKVIDTKVLEFESKEEAFKNYGELIEEFDKKSYDFKAHSFGACKFYREIDGKNILTYVLLYYKGEEYMNVTEEEQDLLYSFMEQ